MLLCYAMLCFTTSIFEPSSLAKPRQPNGHSNQMALVDPLERYKANTPTTHGHPWHRHDQGLTHDYDHNHDHSPDSRSLNSHDSNLLPQHLMYLGYSSTN